MNKLEIIMSMNRPSIKYWLKNILYGSGIKRFLHIQNFINVSPNACLGYNNLIVNPDNLVMEGNSTLKRDSVIMNGRAKFIIRNNSGAAEELMIITGNHMSIVGHSVKDVTNDVKDREDMHNEYDKDIIIDEDVWIGARVTILSGVHVGRGCEIGAGTVLRSSIPPYSIVLGNPAKIVGFRFIPEEAIEHEKKLYAPNDRIPLDVLQSNYNKYFINKMKDIRSFVRI